jgi:hypothetical protein
MTDPIRSQSPSPSTYRAPEEPELLMCVDSEPGASRAKSTSEPLESVMPESTTRTAPGTSRPPREPAAEQPGGSRDLAAKFSKPNPAVAAASRAGNSNAERVQQTPLRALNVDSGTTQHGERFATAALAYGRDPITGLVGEIGTASIQVGDRLEAQVAVGRISVASDDGSRTLSVEALSAHVSAGTHNKDGSEGVHASIGAVYAAAEATSSANGNSVTVGVSAGFSAEYSVGTRDSDGDGFDEYCMRLGAGPVTFGACVEAPDGWDR